MVSAGQSSSMGMPPVLRQQARVASTLPPLAGLGGGEDGGDGKQGGLELHFGGVLICRREF